MSTKGPICIFTFIFQIEDRIGKVAKATKSYIKNYLRNGTAVGIVQFESNSHVLAPMTEVTGANVRDQLASKVPIHAGGGTGIGSGLNSCRSVSCFASDTT